jgi:hypothetical protein
VTPGFTRYTPVASDDAWTVVSGRNLVAVLASGAPSSVTDGLWRLGHRDGVSIEEVVGLVPLAGNGGVRSFVLLTMHGGTAEDGRSVTAVVRGAASVDIVSVGGARRFAAGGVQPWVLADFRAVTGFVIGGDDRPAATTVRPPHGSLPLGGGVVAAARVFWSEHEVLAVAEPERDRPYLRPRAASMDETVIRQGREDRGREDRGHEDQGREDRGREDLGREGPGPEDAGFDDTCLTDHDTILRPAPRDGRGRGRHRRSGDPESASATAGARFRFRLASGEPGEPVELDVPTLFGRNPRTNGAFGGTPPRLVTVSSPDHQVSGTHLRVEQVGQSVVITDLHSTNGTVLNGPGIRRTRLRPGESRVVLPGTTADIGDGNIIEIVSPGHET